jgi:hypothetical protein
MEIHASKAIHKDYPYSLTTLVEDIKAKRMNLKFLKASFAKLLQINPITI